MQVYCNGCQTTEQAIERPVDGRWVCGRCHSEDVTTASQEPLQKGAAAPTPTGGAIPLKLAIPIALGLGLIIALVIHRSMGGTDSDAASSSPAPVLVQDAAPPLPPWVPPEKAKRLPVRQLVAKTRQQVRKILGRASSSSKSEMTYSYTSSLYVSLKFDRRRVVQVGIGGYDVKEYPTELWRWAGIEQSFEVGKTTYRVDTVETQMTITSMPYLMKLRAKEELRLRKRYAVELDRRLTENRIEANVTTRGRKATRLHIRCFLCGKVFINDLMKAHDVMVRLGFKKLTCSDGFQIWTQPL